MRHLRNFNSGRIFESSNVIEDLPYQVAERISQDPTIKAKISKMSAGQLEALEEDLRETLENNKEAAMAGTNERRRYSRNRNRYGYRLNEGIADELSDYASRIAVGAVGGAFMGAMVGVCAYIIGANKFKADAPGFYGQEAGGTSFLRVKNSTENRLEGPFTKDDAGNMVMTESGKLFFYPLMFGAAIGAVLGLVVSAVISARSAFSRGEDMEY